MKKRFMIPLVCVACFASLIALVTMITFATVHSGSEQSESACRFYFDDVVTVKDGETALNEEPGEYIHRIPFTLNKTSDYRFHVTWSTSANSQAADPGFLTVLLLKDSQENIVAHLAMSSGDSEMDLDDLAAGEYTAEYRYYVDEGEARALLSSLSPEISPEPEGSLDRYDSFGREGTWGIRHAFELEEPDLSHRTPYRAGFLIGFGVSILIFAVPFLILMLRSKKKAKKTGYDERQQIARGKAFKYGFYTMFVYYLFLYFSDILDFPLPLDQATRDFLGIILGTIPFCCYSLWKDAYFRMEENKTAVIALFALIAVINTCTGVGNLLSGYAFSEEGHLSLGVLPLMIGVMFLCLLITGVVKTIKDQREADE